MAMGLSPPQSPESRRAERLFGEGGPGRTKHASAGCKLETLTGPAYDAHGDTCIKAFVRLMAAVLRCPVTEPSAGLVLCGYHVGSLNSMI